MNKSIRQKLKENDFIVGIYDSIRQSINKFEFDHWPEKKIKRMYRKRFGFEPDLENPVTLSEKINWMKLYWRDPVVTQCSDKYEVRKYLEDRGFGYLLIKLYGVYDDIEEVDFDSLPDKFALKMNTGSGGNILCTDKSKLDIEKTKRFFKRRMKRNYYYTYGEWGYKDIVPKILCEEYIETEDGKPPKDYKIYCFNGEPRMVSVAIDRVNHQTKYDFYTPDWKWVPLRAHYPNAGDIFPKPEFLEEMLEVTRGLCKDWPQVRVDLYHEGGKIIFGELTFYHYSGLMPFEPASYDKIFGEYFDLPKENVIKK